MPRHFDPSSPFSPPYPSPRAQWVTHGVTAPCVGPFAPNESRAEPAACACRGFAQFSRKRGARPRRCRARGMGGAKGWRASRAGARDAVAEGCHRRPVYWSERRPWRARERRYTVLPAPAAYHQRVYPAVTLFVSLSRTPAINSRLSFRTSPDRQRGLQHVAVLAARCHHNNAQTNPFPIVLPFSSYS